MKHISISISVISDSPSLVKLFTHTSGGSNPLNYSSASCIKMSHHPPPFLLLKISFQNNSILPTSRTRRRSKTYLNPTDQIHRLLERSGGKYTCLTLYGRWDIHHWCEEPFFALLGIWNLEQDFLAGRTSLWDIASTSARQRQKEGQFCVPKVLLTKRTHREARHSIVIMWWDTHSPLNNP